MAKILQFIVILSQSTYISVLRYFFLQHKALSNCPLVTVSKLFVVGLKEVSVL